MCYYGHLTYTNSILVLIMINLLKFDHLKLTSFQSRFYIFFFFIFILSFSIKMHSLEVAKIVDKAAIFDTITFREDTP